MTVLSSSVAGPEPQEELCADTHTSASASPLAGSDTVSFQPLETPQFVAVLMDLRATTDMDQPPPYLPRPPHVRLDVPHEERAIER
ncbi:hypothetical protein BV20DRAFT_973799 [Pilatotrama ljubarskyi]|nr:hypothetical protein BV20DRAFT_973799 [Pilatotrama ljubarskyi]